MQWYVTSVSRGSLYEKFGNKCVKILKNYSAILATLQIDGFSKNLMKANPDKFQAIAIGPKTNKHNLSFDLKGNKIACEENV